MTEYKVVDLKKQFPKLEQQSEFTLIPVFDVVAKRFLNDLNHNSVKYDISYRKCAEQQPNEDLWRSNKQYALVVGGKKVSMIIYEADMDFVDDYRGWWMANRMVFEGNNEGINTLIKHIDNFVSQQNLDEVIMTAKEELRKGQAYHLNTKMLEFYFGKEIFTQPINCGR